MTGERKSYQTITASLSLFGGLQVFSSLLGVLRSKLVAVLMGAEGMGILGLLNGVFGLLAGVGGLGIETSAVKFIAGKTATGNDDAIARIVRLVRYWGWITAATSAAVVAITASWLSVLTFGSDDRRGLLIWLSGALLFKVVSSSQLAILQGTQRLNDMARATFLGNLLGFGATVPLLYFGRIEGLAPSLFAMAACAWVTASLYTRRVVTKNIRLSKGEVLQEGKGLLRLGVSFGIAGLATVAAQYLVQVYINRYGTLAEVGYYSAGMTFLTSYVGILFTAMSADYFPRLSSVSDDRSQTRALLTQQSIVGLLVLLPVVLAFLLFSDWIVDLVFSRAFRSITPFIAFGMFGMLCRAVSFSIGYVILAKADARLFICTSLGFNSLFLVSMVAGYEIGGLAGMGIAFAGYYAVHLVSLLMIVKIRYGLTFNPGIGSVGAVAFGMAILALLATFMSDTLHYVIGGFALGSGSVYAFIQLDRRAGLKETIARKFKR
ncbi:MAG TPA: oligosaccharide flippase family protein [Flavobacterium sp.]|nr:oligosaccharide flippase family protein [Flavobacterium sp.]